MAPHRPHARHQPPDHSRGDESTIGGYMAVHDRPAAFEGHDGYSYSVEIMSEETGDAASPWGAYFLFVKWARIGAQTPEGHLESDYLVRGVSDADVRAQLGRSPLGDVKVVLDGLIAERAGHAPERRWWDAMRDEGADGEP